MSKKTIYKYFSGGKKDALYYFFNIIAIENANQITRFIENLRPIEQINHLIKSIINQGKPYVIQNVSEKEDFLLESEIVGISFRDAYEPILKDILRNGILIKEFHFEISIDLMDSFIYSIIFESMKIIHQDPFKNLLNDVLKIVNKMIL